MSIVLLSDTHWGVRGDRDIFHDYSAKFFNEKFFPYLNSHAKEIEAVIHLGDLVDRRKYINFNTLNRLRTDFLEPLNTWFQKYETPCYFIAGNHDCYYRDTNRINFLSEIIEDYFFTIANKTEEIYLSGNKKILLVPWICPENREDILSQIRESTAEICLGHFELKGYEMYTGTVAAHGDEPDFLKKFQMVCSGHYHKRTSDGWMNYIGSTLQYTWGDYGDDRGFAVLDPTTYNLTYINNDDKLFHKIWYDDSKPVNVPTGLNDRFVKVLVSEKNKPKEFEKFIDAIEVQNPSELQIIEGDSYNAKICMENKVVDTGNAMDVFSEIIAESELNIDKQKLMKVLHDLYMEATQAG